MTGLTVNLLFRLIDLAVDITGVADRSSGSYSLIRSAGLGLLFDDDGCSKIGTLGGDWSVDPPECDDILNALGSINTNQLGKTARLDNGNIHPLMDR